MNSLALDIKDLLEQESSLDLEFGTNLFVSVEPESPDNCVTLYDTSGRIPDFTLSNENYYYDSLQIRARNNNYDNAMNQIYAILEVLQGRYGLTINGVRYSLIRVTIPPFHIGNDENRRAIVVLNIEAQRS